MATKLAWWRSLVPKQLKGRKGRAQWPVWMRVLSALSAVLVVLPVLHIGWRSMSRHIVAVVGGAAAAYPLEAVLPYPLAVGVGIVVALGIFRAFTNNEGTEASTGREGAGSRE